MRQRRLVELGQGGQRVAGRDGIGGVGLDEHGRLLAAQNPTAEVGGNIDDELHLASRDHLAGLRERVRPGHDAEIGGVLERAHDRAREGAIVGDYHGRRQCARIGVDGIAEQGQLNDGNADHHGEGQTVAQHLDEFLHQHGAEAGRREAPLAHGR